MNATLIGYDVCKIEGHVKTDESNPRRQHLCGRCGRLMGPDEMKRDIAQERQWTADAARFAQYVSDPETVASAMSSFREARMGEGPWMDVTQRDWSEEAIEECADLSAYMLAAIQELDEQDRDDEDAAQARMFMFIALSASVTAYQALSDLRRTDL